MRLWSSDINIRIATHAIGSDKILTHSDTSKPVQLYILWACSYCFGVFITTIQALVMK